MVWFLAADKQASYPSAFEVTVSGSYNIIALLAYNLHLLNLLTEVEIHIRTGG